METAYTPEARLQAGMNAEDYIHEHLVSRQTIQYGWQYTGANIRLSGVFVWQ